MRVIFVKSFDLFSNISINRLKHIEKESSRYIIEWDNFKLIVKRNVPVELILKRLQEIEENFDIIEKSELKEILEKESKWNI